VERSFFRQVKVALSGNAQATLEGLGVNFKQGMKGEWSQCLCPFCGDKSGSASMTREGFLRCHQCGRKQDVFDWYAELQGLTPHQACKSIGAGLGVAQVARKKIGRPPKVFKRELLRQCNDALWEDEAAAHLLKFLELRKLDNAQILDQFGVGAMAGYITFAQWTQQGQLRACYRCYSPGGKPPWLWKGGTRGGTTGFWPYYQVPEDGVIWILEGEWDVLTAWARMKLQDQGIYCFTWTGGAGSPVPPHMVPEAWHGREVHILPDNDVFQGPVFEDHKAPTEKDRLNMKLRWRNLMDNIAPSFLAHNCKVFLRAIPNDPLEFWGADFRDWVDGGGRDLSELKSYLFKDMRPKEAAPRDVKFLEAFRLAGKDVKFTAQLGAIDKAEVSVPSATTLTCAMGTMPYCQNCAAPAEFPSGVIHWKDHRDHLARALMKRGQDGFEKYVFRHVIGKPNTCQKASLEDVEYVDGAVWTAMHDDEEEASERSMTIVSEDMPSMSGDVEVTGRVHHANQSFMVMAESIREIDQAVVNLTPFINDFASLCPRSSKPEDIQAYLERRVADLSYNVTKIYGRPDLHIAHELLAHSALWLNVNGKRRRGWLDISAIGDTATGKTETFKLLMEHHGLGTWQNSGENVSRAGLTMGADRSTTGSYKVKPGLFPRNHKKMLVLDEFHIAVREDILKHLQGARDDGRVFASKVFGQRVMPAAVRLCTISNWPVERRRFRFLCEHVQRLYQTPEALRRLDFAVMVAGRPTENELVEVDYEWTEDRVRANLLRSWAMDESMVVIDEKAITYATQKCEEWAGFYSDHLPLFTAEEKHLTLLRIGAAVANLAFSHPPGEPYLCQVELGHVEWAAAFIQRLWDESGYDGYSMARDRTNTLSRPLEAERKTVLGMKIKNHADAMSLLPMLLGGLSQTGMVGVVGEHAEAMNWLADMQRLEVLLREVDTHKAYFSTYVPSKGGDLLLRNLIRCADEYPEAFDRRVERLRMSAIDSSLKMTPLTDPIAKLIHEWENDL
jgi:hypothetical protein